MTNTPRKLKDFSDQDGRRYWWHRPEIKYVPPIYAGLDPDEQQLLEDWFEETDESLVGECTVPAMSLIHGLVMGSNISSIVQCGHYSGYSTLLLGFFLRQMGAERALFSVDIDPEVTNFTQRYCNLAGLQQVVRLRCASSDEPTLTAEAVDYLGSQPSLVFIDSSHQYQHTLAELNLWWEALRPGGILLFHDASMFAAQYDSTSNGGVNRALAEWTSSRDVSAILLNRTVHNHPLSALTYQDGCGLGILQKDIDG